MIPIGSAKQSEGSLQLPKQEVQQAVLVRAIDLGTHENTYKNETKMVRSGCLVFELPNDRTEDDKPLLIYFWTNWSMGTDTYPSKLRKTIQTITKRKLDDKTMGRGFQISDMLGTNCYVNIIHRESNGKTYANVDSFMPLPNGVPEQDSYNEQFEFELNGDGSFDGDYFNKLSEGLKNKILASQEVLNAQ